MSDGQPHLVPPPENRCRFVKTSGARCTTPALRGHDLCFDHRYKVRVIRGQVKRFQRDEPLKVPLINYTLADDHHAILRNLNEISQQLANGAIDYRQAATFTLLQRSILRALRQMHDIEKLETPVEEFVEEQGVTLALPEPATGNLQPDSCHSEPVTCNLQSETPAGAPLKPGFGLGGDGVADASLQPVPSNLQPDSPAGAPLKPGFGLGGDGVADASLQPETCNLQTDPPVDAPPRHEFAPPRVPGLSFNPDTEEGRHNLGQEYIWGYCHKDPVAGLEFGIDLNWPGRPATFVPPPHLAVPPEPATGDLQPDSPSGAPHLPEPGRCGIPPNPDPTTSAGPGLTLNAVAETAPGAPPKPGSGLDGVVPGAPSCVMLPEWEGLDFALYQGTTSCCIVIPQRRGFSPCAVSTDGIHDN
jgi:hypothetical protein